MGGVGGRGGGGAFVGRVDLTNLVGSIQGRTCVSTIAS